MRGIGKSLAAALLLTGGVLILAPTEASAQFPNINSIIRGAMGHGGGGYYRGSGGGHHSRSHSEERESSRDSAPPKEKDATQDESQAANGGTRQTSNGSTSNGSTSNGSSTRTQTSDPGPQQSPPPPSRTANDTPAFSPSR